MSDRTVILCDIRIFLPSQEVALLKALRTIEDDIYVDVGGELPHLLETYGCTLYVQDQTVHLTDIVIPAFGEDNIPTLVAHANVGSFVLTRDSADYSLRLDYSDLPGTVSWKLDQDIATYIRDLIQRDPNV